MAALPLARPALAERVTEIVVPNIPTMDSNQLEFAETSCVALEWKLSGLKAIFESSKGETKSKCIKSAVFGDPDNLWELLFYGNSGPTTSSSSNQNQSMGQPAGPSQAGEFASFYLSAVPTQEEKNEGIKGKWTRKGFYAFRFEIKTPGKTALIAGKEATNHVFSSKTVNWGWQSFAKRDTLYYAAHPMVRQTDSFVVCCTVASSPTPPAGYWLGHPSAVNPLSLTAMPTADGRVAGHPSSIAPAAAWSGSSGGWKGLAGGNGAMAIQQARKLVPKNLVESFGGLCDDPVYSDVVFLLPVRSSKGLDQTTRVDGRGNSVFRDASPFTSPAAQPDETSPTTMSGQADISASGPPASAVAGDLNLGPMARLTPPARPKTRFKKVYAIKKILRRSDYFVGMFDSGFSESAGGRADDDDAEMRSTYHGDSEDDIADDSDLEEDALFPDEESTADLDDDNDTEMNSYAGPPKTQKVIREASYRTWKALIYYLYTDIITFAPLTSSFIPPASPAGETSPSMPSRPSSLPIGFVAEAPVSGRHAWIQTWMAENREGTGELRQPAPCSAKAIYRLADKFDLQALRQRAFQHIVSQLTVQNIPYEAFSPFSATYEQVRKVEVAFFLAHWNEIKGSPAMANIWQHIRLGRHLGFEEVWPFIVSNLEFRATKNESGSGVTNNRDDA